MLAFPRRLLRVSVRFLLAFGGPLVLVLIALVGRALPARAAPARAEGAAGPERVILDEDGPAWMVRADDGGPPSTVFLPGVCSNARAYLTTFPAAARAHGGVLALDGDVPCGSGLATFSWDVAKLNARIERALTKLARPGGSEGITVIGYSQGAWLAERLAERWPSRYARIVLIGAPTDPSAVRLARARAVVTMSCSRDVPTRMKTASRALARIGVPSTYLEMPGCTHGDVANPEPTFAEALSFVHREGR